MSERTGEVTVDAGERTDSNGNGQRVDNGEPVDGDRVAERFLELEAELAAGAEATLPDGTVRTGRVVDAALLSAAEVPESYPVDVDTDHALGLTVELESNRQVPTYLDWPENRDTGEDSTLGRLLAGFEIAPERLAELYGRRVLVEVVDGRYTLYLPEEQPRGTGRDIYGVVAGVAASIATLGGVGLDAPLALLGFLLVTVLVLPGFTYRDSWYLRTHSDWEGGPVFWATLAMLPGLNLLSTAVYLRARHSATYL